MDNNATGRGTSLHSAVHTSEVPFLHLAQFSLSVRIIFHLQIKFNLSIKKYYEKRNLSIYISFYFLSTKNNKRWYLVN